MNPWDEVPDGDDPNDVVPLEGIRPYAGTSGYAAGVATSRERALTEDADGTTSKRQALVVSMLGDAKERGVTWSELSWATRWHHGQSSGVLSVLHKAGKIARLTERRNRCHVYVLPEHVAGRETQRQGRRGGGGDA